jgi:DNA repair protein RadC
VRDLPERLQPREIVERMGVENVPDDVLLAVILRSGVRGTNVLELARRLLQRYGSLTGLASSSLPELRAERGMGRVKTQVLMAALALGRRMSEEQAPERRRVKTPHDVMSILRDHVRQLDREVFWVLLLDPRNRLVGRPVEVTHGLLDASLVHPREVFREAIRSATAAVVLAHNHPSGDPAPSAEDVRITRQMISAGKIVDIRVLDHVILGRERAGMPGYCSLREDGIVEF